MQTRIEQFLLIYHTRQSIDFQQRQVSALILLKAKLNSPSLLHHKHSTHSLTGTEGRSSLQLNGPRL